MGRKFVGNFMAKFHGDIIYIYIVYIYIIYWDIYNIYIFIILWEYIYIYVYIMGYIYINIYLYIYIFISPGIIYSSCRKQLYWHWAFNGLVSGLFRQPWFASNLCWGSHLETDCVFLWFMVNPLVNVYITMDNHHFFMANSTINGNVQ